MSTATAEPKAKNRVELFTEQVLDKLPYAVRASLHRRLGHHGSNRLTRLINPLADSLGDFTAQEVKALAEVLAEASIDVPAHELITEWGLGRNAISIDEANELVANDGFAWGLVHHIA